MKFDERYLNDCIRKFEENPNHKGMTAEELLAQCRGTSITEDLIFEQISSLVPEIKKLWDNVSKKTGKPIEELMQEYHLVNKAKYEGSRMNILLQEVVVHWWLEPNPKLPKED